MSGQEEGGPKASGGGWEGEQATEALGAGSNHDSCDGNHRSARVRCCCLHSRLQLSGGRPFSRALLSMLRMLTASARAVTWGKRKAHLERRGIFSQRI